jgi:hypothetical protein
MIMSRAIAAALLTFVLMLLRKAYDRVNRCYG